MCARVHVCACVHVCVHTCVVQRISGSPGHTARQNKAGYAEVGTKSRITLYATQGSYLLILTTMGSYKVFRQGKNTVRLVFRKITLQVQKAVKGEQAGVRSMAAAIVQTLIAPKVTCTFEGTQKKNF